MATRTTKKRSAKPGARRYGSSHPPGSAAGPRAEADRRTARRRRSGDRRVGRGRHDDERRRQLRGRRHGARSTISSRAKEAILGALAERPHGRHAFAHRVRGRARLRTLPLAALTGAIVDPLAEFFRRTPAYSHVFHAIDRPGARDRAMRRRLHGRRPPGRGHHGGARPDLDPKRRRVHAMAAVGWCTRC